MSNQGQRQDHGLVLALDIGTSSARAALFGSQGALLPGTLVRAGYRLRTTEDGGAELDPEELAQAVEELIDRAVKLAGNRQILGVGMATFWHSLLGVDAKGRPTTAILTWADTRASAAVPALRARLDPEAHHRRTGAYLHPSYPVARLAWLRAEQRDIWERTTRWLSFAEHLFLRWFGQATCSVSMASGTGLFDHRTLDWDLPTLEALGIQPNRLPPIGDEPASGLRADYARRWPALANAAWFPAWGDGACSNVGSGAVGLDRLALMVGTSGAMRLLWEGQPVEPPFGLWLYRLDRRRLVLGGALSEGGNFIDWVCREFRLPPLDELQEALVSYSPGTHGLTWLPFIAGERSPGWAGHARATLSGLHLDTTALEVLRAALEAVACRFVLVHRLIQEAVPGERLIVGSGNGLVNNRAWAQIMADALGQPLAFSPEPEASLRGAALVTLERLGLGSLEELARPAVEGAARVAPNPDHAPAYEAMIARQQALYRLLIGETS